MFGSDILSGIGAASAIVLLGVTAQAGPKLPDDCEIRDGSPYSCSPMVGCLGVTDYFTGRALGWNKGSHISQSGGGLNCIGEWRGSGRLGLGEATVECDGDLTGLAYFYSRDPQTGTGRGMGRLSDGRTLRVWYGQEVEQFLRNEYGDVNYFEMCKNADAPIG
ncbi:hypothetical protein [Falsiphaeobacter marinintestinus]|uniref:hypothetical protein n=1 Tax=Falsiphaeobacter marinintestinus TaxID=1492905 RepID=UPI0011B82C41|nr:hypothetical protein [Phaeobacter marinintestinus]